MVFCVFFMQTGGPDFILEGFLARNRALMNDVVVVQLVEDKSEMAQVCIVQPKF